MVDPDDDLARLQARLAVAEAEITRLRRENAALKAVHPRSRPLVPDRPTPLPPLPVADVAVTATPATPEAKLALFRSFFTGREDVYAQRWENPDGRSGYAPARKPPWERQGDATDYLPLTDDVIRDHLTGRRFVGLFPMLRNETCWLLAVDFDKAGWQDDAAAFRGVCEECSVPVLLERSRSGNGAHAWIFFTEPVAAQQARRLGSGLLTRVLERRHELGLSSYDRLFPNQDTLPKGGFGNLIALPLHGRCRRAGTTVFIEQAGLPFADQWGALAATRKLSPADVDSTVAALSRSGPLIPIRVSRSDDDEVGGKDRDAELAEDDPWTLPPSKRKPEPPIVGPLPATARLTQANLVYVEKAGLPAPLLSRLTRLAAFQNPEFYRAQAMRLSTFGKPRIIDCSADHPQHLGLPRGCLAEVVELFERHQVRTEISDQRASGASLDVDFHGELRPEQEHAARTMLSEDIGVLCAPTAFGKTVVAAWLIAQRRTSTLILVHRKHLLEQWRERLATFLGVPATRIGQLGGGRTRPTGALDVALLQSLQRKGEVQDIVAQYGHVIVDECHHIPAFSFEAVLREAKARYVLGLTATPVRKDGHHPIVVMQCGPVRVRVDARGEAAKRPFDHRVIARRTAFQLPPEVGPEPGIQVVYALLAADAPRNRLICDDVCTALAQGRSPLLLTERRDHLELLADALRGDVPNLVVLHGTMGTKARHAALDQLRSIPSDAPRLLLATGRYIGEGFDDARLDTLFLTLPVSWRGTIQQYAGRLHRLYATKLSVVAVDYVDTQVSLLMKMYQRRLKGYAASGYEVPSMTDLLVAGGATLSFPQSAASTVGSSESSYEGSTVGETGRSDLRGAVGDSEEPVPCHVPST